MTSVSEVSDWLRSRKIPLTAATEFGLEPGTKTGRPAIRYDVDGYERYRFIDACIDAPKYLWGRKGVVLRTWYGLPQAARLISDQQTARVLWVANGEPSVWHAWTLGLPAVCSASGEGSGIAAELVRASDRLDCEIAIVFDADSAGRQGAQRLAGEIVALGCDRVSIVDILTARPRHLMGTPKGYDLDDLCRDIREKHPGAERLELVEHLAGADRVKIAPPEKPVPTGGSHWHLADIVVRRLTLGGVAPVWSRGYLWRYEPARGIWRPYTDLVTAIGELDGMQIGFGEKPRYLDVNKNAVLSILFLISERFADETFFDNPRDGVTMRNGTLTTEGELVPHSPEHRHTHQVGADWTCPSSASIPGWWHTSCRHDVWKKALKNWFGQDLARSEEHQLLQEFAGAILYTITGKSLWLIGGGGNGKSQILDVLSALVPADSRTNLAPSKLDGPKAEYYVAYLAKSRLNVDADIPSTFIEDPSEWKKTVTGDEVTGRDPRGKPFGFRPRLIHLFSANTIPSVGDHSDGFWRRVVTLRMDRRADEAFPGIEDLAARVIAHEMEAVVAWAAEGALRLLKNKRKFTIPQTSTEDMQDWREGSDSVLAWFRACCDRNDPAIPEEKRRYIPARTLWREYSAWCRSQGSQPVHQRGFSKRLAPICITRRGRASLDFYVTVIEVAGGGEPAYPF